MIRLTSPRQNIHLIAIPPISKMSLPQNVKDAFALIRDLLPTLTAQELVKFNAECRAILRESSRAYVYRTALEAKKKDLWEPIPFDICYMIFSHCLADEDPTKHSDMPAKLSLINRKSRDFAKAMPYLWSNIVLDKPSWFEFSLSLECATRRFTRSGAFPINIHCKFPPDIADTSWEITQRTLTLFANNLSHTNSIYIQTHRPNDVPAIIQYFLVPAPILTSFHIIQPHPVSNDNFQSTRTSVAGLFAHQAPRLTSASFPSLSLNWSRTVLSNITNLFITHRSDFGVSITQLIDVFQLSHLVTLEIRGFYLQLRFDDTPRVVVNKSIQELTLGSQSLGDCLTILGRLNLLVLSSLRVDGYCHNLDPPILLTSLPFPNIHSFYLTRESNFSRGVAELMRRMPSLQTFGFSGFRLAEEAFGRNDPIGFGPNVAAFPRLAELMYLRQPELDTASIPSIQRILEKIVLYRYADGCPLERVTIPHLGERSDDIKRALQNIRPELVIEVCCYQNYIGLLLP